MTQKNLWRATPVLLGVALALAAFIGAGASAYLSASPQIGALIGLCVVGFSAVAIELRARRLQTARLEDALMRLAGGLERAGARLGALDDRTRDVEQWILSHARPGVEQSAAEIEVLGTLVKELAVTVAHHDAELGGAQQASPAPTHAATPPAPDKLRIAAAAIDRAVRDGAFDLHLQPIVSLPQRRVKFYEAFARLRDDNGDAFMLAANTPGVDGARRADLDLAMLRRLFVVARRLAQRSRDIAIFVHVSERTAGQPEALLSALQGVQELASHLVILISQTTARSLGAAGLARLKPVLDLGFSLGLDGVIDLRLDARTLFDHGVRYVKAPAALLLADAERAPSEIHPQDLARLLARNGVQLIGSGVDLEKTVAEALDLDLRFGQGDAFSPPRPVKPELLEPLPEQPIQPTAPAANDAPTPAAPQRLSYRSTLRRA